MTTSEKQLLNISDTLDKIYAALKPQPWGASKIYAAMQPKTLGASPGPSEVLSGSPPGVSPCDPGVKPAREAPSGVSPLAQASATTKPPIVCLCGSTRFFTEFQEASLRETVSGKIVLSIGCNLRSDHQLWADPAEREAIKARLDELHKRKIDLCDDVLVLNIGGYIGSSTRSEIEYAIKIGKPIRYLEPLAQAPYAGPPLQVLKDREALASAPESRKCDKCGKQVKEFLYSCPLCKDCVTADTAPETRFDFEKVLKEKVQQVSAQREEILTAFVAKYGFQPDEIEQVFGPDGKWFVRRKTPAPKPEPNPTDALVEQKERERLGQLCSNVYYSTPGGLLAKDWQAAAWAVREAVLATDPNHAAIISLLEDEEARAKAAEAKLVRIAEVVAHSRKTPYLTQIANVNSILAE